MYIIAGQLFTDTIAIKESLSTDTVTFKVYKQDGTTLAQGSCSYVAGITWKFSFTPSAVGDVLQVEVTNVRLDQTWGKGESYQVVSSSTVTQPVGEDEDPPTTAELLVMVDRAIANRISGGAVQSYSVGGRNLQYLTLKELRDLRKEITMEIAAAAGPARNLAKFDTL